MVLRSDVDTSGSIDAHAADSDASMAPFESSFDPQSSCFVMGAPTPSFSINNALTRPHGRVQRSTSDTEMERRMPYDIAHQTIKARGHSTSLDAERMREEPHCPVLMHSSAPDSENAVSSRPLHVEPQLTNNQSLVNAYNRTLSNHPSRLDLNENEAIHVETERPLQLHEDTSPRQRRNSYSSINVPLTEENLTSSSIVSEVTMEPETASVTPRDQEDDEQTVATEELVVLLRRWYCSVPFVALICIYFAYQHEKGICLFLLGTGSIIQLDNRMRAQVARKDKANCCELIVIVLACYILMVLLSMIEPSRMYLISPRLYLNVPHGSNSGLDATEGIFWQVLYTVLVNDFIIRLWSIIMKAFVAGTPSTRCVCKHKNREEEASSGDHDEMTQLDEEEDGSTSRTPLTQHVESPSGFYRRKRKLYGLIELSSIFFRSLLASVPWCSMYQACASKIMANVLTLAYLVFKTLNQVCDFQKALFLATQIRRIFTLARSFVTLRLEFGVYVTHDELVESGAPNCSICYEAMRRPVKLACSHIFCEECVTEWFDHERSCPLCRASVGSGTSSEENFRPQFLDGRTSLGPQLL
ncbi:hypothetical protein CCR75_006942 [Bremia lactucae]|uniref:RING-type domain-containing protein n=1 Tax=Bremia lactucae TaxID=4779 RepID=A0A976IG45_BRELC|nr:hypothetical protein CCR75_006942 [Bremia lactucae]